MESLRFARCRTQLRAIARTSCAARCSAAIAANEFQPLESLRCFRCRSALLVLIASRRAAAIATHEFQPADCFRRSRCCSDLEMLSRFRCALT